MVNKRLENSIRKAKKKFSKVTDINTIKKAYDGATVTPDIDIEFWIRTEMENEHDSIISNF